MYDNLKEKTNKTVDKSVDATRMAAQPEHDDVWVTSSATVKNAGVGVPAVSDNAQINAHVPVSDPGITEQRSGTQLKKAEI